MFKTLLLTLAVGAAAAPVLEERYVPPNAYKATIHPNGHKSKCLTVNGAITMGTEIVIKDCDFTKPNVYFYVAPGATYIMHENEKLCLDAGTNFVRGFYPHNGARAKLAPCPSESWPSPYDSPDGTKWEFVDGNRLRMKGLNFCLDNADGGMCDGNPVQIWDCHDENHPDAANQQWNMLRPL